jgi:hypothetical protein
MPPAAAVFALRARFFAPGAAIFLAVYHHKNEFGCVVRPY